MKLLLLAALVAGALASCELGDDPGPGSRGCKTDQDCGDEAKCVVSTGVCVGFETPLEAVDAGRVTGDQ